jgi:superfamily II DNA helicase RecQ
VCEPDEALVRAVTAPVATARRGRSGAAARARARAGGAAHEERDDLPPVDEQAFERLRAWRYERAEGKPAYTVAANAVLEDVLRAAPNSIESLLEIRGIGPAFCEKHGPSLLAELVAIDSREAAAAATSSMHDDAHDRAATPLASPGAPT